jgi:tetratricopeptide (TPR) repeat protein
MGNRSAEPMNPQFAATNKKQQKLARLVKSGKLREAVQILRPLCKKRPHDAQGWMSLASVCGQLGDYRGVLDACSHLTRLQPQAPAPYSLMGNALACLGRFDEAGAQYRKALDLRPDDPAILNNLGNALYLEGRLDEAAETLQKTVRLRPDYADAHNNLGNIYKALNDNSLAVRHFQLAIRYHPDLFEAHLNLADIFVDRIGHPDAAEQHYLRAVQLNPQSIQARAGLANVHRYLGRLDQALEVVRETQALFPAEKSAVANEADILERKGDRDAAFRVASGVVKNGSPDPMAADVLLRVCRQTGTCSDAIEVANRLIADATTKDPGREMLHFSLGKLYDKLEDYDTAFRHYRAANEVFDRPFDTSAHRERINRLIEVFSSANVATLPRSAINDRRCIFIVGMPRSGTSLTEQILASHPRVAGAGELNEINDIVASLRRDFNVTGEYPLCINELREPHLDQMARRYLNKLSQYGEGHALITDKMPHNFLNLGMIRLMFPECRIIHCARDPRDTCLSIYFQSFGWLHSYGTRLEWLGQYYREYLRLMKHWQTVLEPTLLTVSYEEMVGDQERVTRQILEYCGLDWDDACLDFHKSERVVATASYDQVRQKLYTKSRARWKNYEKHLQPLIEALGDATNEWDRVAAD